MCKSDFLISIAIVLFVFTCSFGLADVVQVPELEDERTVGTVYKMTVTPAKETLPAFKYRLTVEPYKTIPGNAISHYLRSLGESSLNRPWEKAKKEFGMEVHSWYDLKVKAEDIPVDKLRIASGYFDSYVENHLRRATMCRDSDWGLAVEDLRGWETLEFKLPSVQQTRSMARALMLRNRLAVIEGRYEDSVDLLRMTYQLGQNVNKMKLLVASLVGIAEIGMANQGMIDLIAAKDSPNMYWALAELPQPIISMRESLRLDVSLGLRFFPELMDAETAEYSQEKWSASLARVIGSLQEISKSMGGGGDHDGDVISLPTKLLAMGAGISSYTLAKHRLLDSGMAVARVEKMPVAQVLLIDAARDYQLHMDEIEKTYYLPYEKTEAFRKQFPESMQSPVPTRLGRIISNMIGPAIEQVRQAEVRVQAQINLLMAVESIRDHIATTGRFPASLDELKLPVRRNPLTGKPISYELDGETAVLSLFKTSGSSYSQRIVISIAPK